MSQFFRRGCRPGTSPTHLGTRAVIQDTINEQRVLLMPGQSKLMPGQMPGYARVWLRLWSRCCTHQLLDIAGGKNGKENKLW